MPEGGRLMIDSRKPFDQQTALAIAQCKEKAARRRLVLGHPSRLFFESVSGVPRCILHISRGVVGGSLGLIDLAFGFHVLVTTELTGTFFDGAFCLVGGALHMFAIHNLFLCSLGCGTTKQMRSRSS